MRQQRDIGEGATDINRNAETSRTGLVSHSEFLTNQLVNNNTGLTLVKGGCRQVTGQFAHTGSWHYSPWTFHPTRTVHALNSVIN